MIAMSRRRGVHWQRHLPDSHRTITAWLAAACTMGVAGPGTAIAQSRTLTMCTPGTLGVCTDLRLTASPGLFEIAIGRVAATGLPGLPISVYNLVLSTGAPAASIPNETLVVPAAEGGATVGDAAAWDVFDTGDALFLSALSNRGVGGCASGLDMGEFGQAVSACGVGAFARFSFVPILGYNPDAFEVLNLEAVALTDPLAGVSCGAAGAACVITADTRATVTPEPVTVWLVGAGLAGLLAAGRRTAHRRG